MTRQLESEFNLPPIEDAIAATNASVSTKTINEISETVFDSEVVDNKITLAEKINFALKEISSTDNHTTEMDDIAEKALDSYAQLMSLGMNVSDMAAGKIFAEASTFLKLAMESRDAKSKARATELDLMIKKLKIDKTKNVGDAEETSKSLTQTFDRNDLLKIFKDNP